MSDCLSAVAQVCSGLIQFSAAFLQHKACHIPPVQINYEKRRRFEALKPVFVQFKHELHHNVS